MQKKIIVLAASAMMLAGFISESSAATVRTSPFTDNLTITFSGFLPETVFGASYQDNNGVNITGPELINIGNSALVQIYSKNKVDNGYPVMTMQYPDDSGTMQTCAITFIDGPWAILNYENGVAPVCPGISIGNISMTARHQFKLTVADSEP